VDDRDRLALRRADQFRNAGAESRAVTDRLLNTLKHERERLGLTQAALAEHIGVSRKTINGVENGVFIPCTVLALKLAAALDQPFEALFQLEEDGPNTWAAARSQRPAAGDDGTITCR
jgi:putative transcriptional regulator